MAYQASTLIMVFILWISRHKWFRKWQLRQLESCKVYKVSSQDDEHRRIANNCFYHNTQLICCYPANSKRRVKHIDDSKTEEFVDQTFGPQVTILRFKSQLIILELCRIQRAQICMSGSSSLSKHTHTSLSGKPRIISQSKDISLLCDIIIQFWSLN